MNANKNNNYSEANGFASTSWAVPCKNINHSLRATGNVTMKIEHCQAESS